MILVFNTQLESTARSFRSVFTTEDYLKRFERQHPQPCGAIVKRYGPWGHGAGRHYTSGSYVAQRLGGLVAKGVLEMLDFVDASEEWGSPVVRTWRVA
jgi:hypothetical protein